MLISISGKLERLFLTENIFQLFRQQNIINIWILIITHVAKHLLYIQG